MKSVRAPRLRLHVTRVFIVSTPVRGPLFARPESGTYRSRFRLLRVNYVRLVPCLRVFLIYRLPDSVHTSRVS